ncbi:MAG: homoserine kinase [Burkholderiaceae bacterium]
MAVYTALDDDALIEWLACHAVGTLVACRGIASGIENTNYFVTTRDADRDRRFVLTLFERLGADQLPYYLSLMRHLAASGTPCPAPMPARDGALFSMLAGKPAALVTRLEGASALAPTPAHCAELGTALARMHEAGTHFDASQTNPRGIDWWVATARNVRDFLDADQRSLLDDEIALQASDWARVTVALPHGPIHADLFRDNALFVETADGPKLGGVIDFYFAGNDVWLLDIATCINDWCVELASGAIDAPRLDAFLDAYQKERPLNVAEHDALPQVLRAAALRFWLSRLEDLHRPRPAQLLTPHDPTHFERLLRMRRDEAARL